MFGRATITLGIGPHFSYLKNHMSKLHEMFCTCHPVAVARSSSDDNATSIILPVLWMMSSFNINTAHALYGNAYGRGMSVSRRQRRGGAGALKLRPFLRCILLANILQPLAWQ